MSEFCDIQQLAKLLNPQQHESDPEELDDVADSKEGRDSNTKTNNPYEKLEIVEREPKEIIEDNPNDCATNDWKLTPKWVISYQQKVTASDVFLQLGAKTPSTSSCENMLITIDLPGEKMQNIDVKTFKNKLTIESPRFYLNLPLPHPIDPQQGKANWDKINEKLIITLVMEREFDFVNF